MLAILAKIAPSTRRTHSTYTAIHGHFQMHIILSPPLQPQYFLRISNYENFRVHMCFHPRLTTPVSPRHLLHSSRPTISFFATPTADKDAWKNFILRFMPQIRMHIICVRCLLNNPKSTHSKWHYHNVMLPRPSGSTFLSDCHSWSLGPSEVCLYSIIQFLAFSASFYRSPN